MPLLYSIKNTYSRNVPCGTFLLSIIVPVLLSFLARFPLINAQSLSTTFNFIGEYQYYSLPACANGLFEVHLWGAGGSSCCNNGCGGAGAYVTGKLRLSSGNTTLRIIVGKAGIYRGSPGSNSADVYGGGGDGYYKAPGYVGSGGGGRSAIQMYRQLVNGTLVWQEIVTAGGGGGGSPASGDCTSSGGAGSWNGTGHRGGDQVQTTVTISGSYAGGGSSTMGGEGVNPGQAFRGGDGEIAFCCSYHGGGGGGFYGGGGGLHGGGGSSLITYLENPNGEDPPMDKPYQGVGRSSPFWSLNIGASNNHGRVGIIPLCSPSASATATATKTSSPTASGTKSALTSTSATASATATKTSSSSSSAMPSVSATSSVSATMSASATASSSASNSASASSTSSSSSESSSSGTVTSSTTSSASSSSTATSTGSASSTATSSTSPVLPSGTATVTPTSPPIPPKVTYDFVFVGLSIGQFCQTNTRKVFEFTFLQILLETVMSASKPSKDSFEGPLPPVFIEKVMVTGIRTVNSAIKIFDITIDKTLCRFDEEWYYQLVMNTSMDNPSVPVGNGNRNGNPYRILQGSTNSNPSNTNNGGNLSSSSLTDSPFIVETAAITSTTEGSNTLSTMSSNALTTIVSSVSQTLQLTAPSIFGNTTIIDVRNVTAITDGTTIPTNGQIDKGNGNSIQQGVLTNPSIFIGIIVGTVIITSILSILVTITLMNRKYNRSQASSSHAPSTSSTNIMQPPKPSTVLMGNGSTGTLQLRYIDPAVRSPIPHNRSPLPISSAAIMPQMTSIVSNGGGGNGNSAWIVTDLDNNNNADYTRNAPSVATHAMVRDIVSKTLQPHNTNHTYNLYRRDVETSTTSVRRTKFEPVRQI